MKGSDSNLKELVDKKADGVIKKVLKSNYNDLVKKYQKDGGKWTDPDFPPEESSIGSVDERIVRATWRRIPEIIKNPEFVSGKIEPSDVLQGSIGDCYFLSSIAALA